MDELEQVEITDDGFAKILLILERDAELEWQPLGDPRANVEYLDSRADVFLRKSREKGNRRSKDEEDEALLVAYFKTWCEEILKRQVN